jgi:hypothetical protein
MNRHIIVILSIANLLLCPLVCMGVLRCADREVTIQKSTCGCGMCENSRKAPTDPVSPAENRCDSCQCVCGGALSLAKSGPQVSPALGLWPAFDLVEDLLPSEPEAQSPSELAGCPPGESSGRLLRLELASLLC